MAAPRPEPAAADAARPTASAARAAETPAQAAAASATETGDRNNVSLPARGDAVPISPGVPALSLAVLAEGAPTETHSLQPGEPRSADAEGEAAEPMLSQTNASPETASAASPPTIEPIAAAVANSPSAATSAQGESAAAPAKSDGLEAISAPAQQRASAAPALLRPHPQDGQTLAASTEASVNKAAAVQAAHADAERRGGSARAEFRPLAANADSPSPRPSSEPVSSEPVSSDRIANEASPPTREPAKPMRPSAATPLGSAESKGADAAQTAPPPAHQAASPGATLSPAHVHGAASAEAMRPHLVRGDAGVDVNRIPIEIAARVNEGQHRFEIRLDPPELGRIAVQLDVDATGKVTSHLLVDRPETLDLLRRDAPALERALQSAGLKTDGGLEFSLRDQPPQRDHAAQPNDRPAEAATIDQPDELAAADLARRRYGRLLGLGLGLDIRV